MRVEHGLPDRSTVCQPRCNRRCRASPARRRLRPAPLPRREQAAQRLLTATGPRSGRRRPRRKPQSLRSRRLFDGDFDGDVGLLASGRDAGRRSTAVRSFGRGTASGTSRTPNSTAAPIPTNGPAGTVTSLVSHSVQPALDSATQPVQPVVTASSGSAAGATDAGASTARPSGRPGLDGGRTRPRHGHRSDAAGRRDCRQPRKRDRQAHRPDRSDYGEGGDDDRQGRGPGTGHRGERDSENRRAGRCRGHEDHCSRRRGRNERPQACHAVDFEGCLDDRWIRRRRLERDEAVGLVAHSGGQGAGLRERPEREPPAQSVENTASSAAPEMPATGESDAVTHATRPLFPEPRRSGTAGPSRLELPGSAPREPRLDLPSPAGVALAPGLAAPAPIGPPMTGLGAGLLPSSPVAGSSRDPEGPAGKPGAKGSTRSTSRAGQFSVPDVPATVTPPGAAAAAGGAGVVAAIVAAFILLTPRFALWLRASAGLTRSAPAPSPLERPG